MKSQRIFFLGPVRQEMKETFRDIRIEIIQRVSWVTSVVKLRFGL